MAPERILLHIDKHIIKQLDLGFCLCDVSSLVFKLFDRRNYKQLN
jgi:hypothetical protein